MAGRIPRYWPVIFGVIVLLIGLAAVVRLSVLRRAGILIDSGPGKLTPIKVPSGFRVSVFAEGLDTPRLMAIGPDGVVYVAERGKNRVIALPDRDQDTRADRVVVVADGLQAPSSLAFQGPALLVGETNQITRLTLDAEGRATARAVLIPNLPPAGQHTTRTILVMPDGRLMVSVGSSCNVCNESDPRRAAISVYQPDGSGGRTFSSGLRNAVGLAVNPWTNEVWATNNGRDLWGDDRPPETVNSLTDGADFGWPRCHAGDLVDPNYGQPGGCQGVTPPAIKLAAHMAPLGLEFVNRGPFPAAYQGLYIALHGSWNSSVKVGYKVMFVPLRNGRVAGEAVDFATGFVRGDDPALGRPVGVTLTPDGSLLVSDDKGGYIYRIAYGR